MIDKTVNFQPGRSEAVGIFSKTFNETAQILKLLCYPFFSICFFTFHRVSSVQYGETTRRHVCIAKLTPKYLRLSRSHDLIRGSIRFVKTFEMDQFIVDHIFHIHLKLPSVLVYHKRKTTTICIVSLDLDERIIRLETKSSRILPLTYVTKCDMT